MPIYTHPSSPTLSASEASNIQANADRNNQNVSNNILSVELPVITRSSPSGIFVNGNAQMEPWWLFYDNGILAFLASAPIVFSCSTHPTDRCHYAIPYALLRFHSRSSRNAPYPQDPIRVEVDDQCIERLSSIAHPLMSPSDWWSAFPVFIVFCWTGVLLHNVGGHVRTKELLISFALSMEAEEFLFILDAVGDWDMGQ